MKVSASATRAVAAPAATSASPALLQRQCECGQHTLSGECDDCKQKKMTLLRRFDGLFRPATVPPVVSEVLCSPGQPLDVYTRSLMEPRFSHDFTRVQLHTDARAAESARTVSALAYTVGDHIAFQSGHYDPSSVFGQRLLAHELAHVVQYHRHGNRVAGASRLISQPADASEREATDAAQRVMSGRDAAVVESPGATLHRLSDEAIRDIKIGAGVVLGAGVLISGIAYLAGKFITDHQLQEYLKKLDDTNKTEGNWNSDEKARKVIDSWAQGETKFVVTVRRRALMVQEMLDGHVSRWDKDGIMNVLERSGDLDLNYLFGPGGVSHATLIAKLDSWKEEVQSFYKRRYKGVDVYMLKDFSILTAESAGPIQPGDEIPKEDSDDVVNPLSGTKRRTKRQPVEPAESDKWVTELYGSYLAKNKAGGHFIQKDVDVNIAEDKGEDDTADAQFAGALSSHCQKEKDWYTAQKKDAKGGKALSAQDKQEISDRYQYCVTNPSIAAFYESPEEAGEKKGQIWVHRQRESATTRLHESLHAYANPSVTAKLPHFASEGMTEYFTRQIALRKNLAISTSYEGPFLAIQEFSARFGETVLARVYFQGESSLICKSLVERFGEGAFKDWSIAMSSGDSWQDALKVMQRPKPAQPPKDPAECAP